MQNTRLTRGFGFCTPNVLRDPSLNMRDKAVYAYLCTFADSTTNELFVSVYKMASELNVTPITVIRSLKELETRKIISRMRKGNSKAKITTILK